MSALTDLFTALANKIRSKTGEATTYTPLQMVSDGIDDVYQAGVDAGETPTQTKTVTAGTSAVTVTPDTGYALSSVTVNPTPSQSKVATPTTSAQTISPDSGKLLSSVSVGAIQTQTKSATPSTSAQTVTPDSGKYLSQVNVGAIPSDYVIPTSITPSNTSPASMASGGAYKPSASGYAISSYDSVTPSTSGAYFSSGMKKMASSGYAYSSKPQMTETTLWTNSDPTSAFGSTSASLTNASNIVTLSQSYANFDYIKITFRFQTTNSTEASVLIPKDVLDRSTTVSTFAIGMNSGSGNTRVRTGAAISNTQMSFLPAYQTTTSSQSAQTVYIIPTKISGLKL